MRPRASLECYRCDGLICEIWMSYGFNNVGYV